MTSPACPGRVAAMGRGEALVSEDGDPVTPGVVVLVREDALARAMARSISSETPCREVRTVRWPGDIEGAAVIVANAASCTPAQVKVLVASGSTVIVLAPVVDAGLRAQYMDAGALDCLEMDIRQLGSAVRSAMVAHAERAAGG